MKKIDTYPLCFKGDKNIAYYPLSYELSYDKGIPQHNVILHGLRSHSIVKANLSKVRNAI